MAKPAEQKVLFVCHNHPAVRPGGAELYALDLYEAVRDEGTFEPLLLARTGNEDNGLPVHAGTPIACVGDDPNQYFLYTDLSTWDWFFGRHPDKTTLTRHYREFLLAQRPDVVHFQHTQFIGYDIVRVTRNTLPDVPIVYTLHEYLPICYSGGQMVRTKGNELCNWEDPRRCEECFPDVSAQQFFARKRFIQSHLAHVDQFLIPSEEGLERYVEWGIPREKLTAFDHGFKRTRMAAEETERPRNRFGFFGQFTPTKGADVLLEAVVRLGDGFDGHVLVNGANLDRQPEEYRERLGDLIERTRGTVTFGGSYDRSDLPKLMQHVDWIVVPSIWPETGPLTIAEAFMHGRPVICTDLGGMAERVTDGVNGLHFRRTDADDLAETMRRAAETPGLWEQLRAGIPEVQTIEQHARTVIDIYLGLLDRPPAGIGIPRAPARAGAA